MSQLKENPFSAVCRKRIKKEQKKSVNSHHHFFERKGHNQRQHSDVLTTANSDIAQTAKQQSFEFGSEPNQNETHSKFGDIIGKSKSMQLVFDLILKAAASDSNVVVYGESGTGKELVAKAIRDLSDRHDKPFVVVNCGAIAESLFESELFGYVKGAFTGAADNKKGYFDRAERGTLFLDEIGDIPLAMQVKLLRVVEGGGFIPVGGSKVKYSNVRMVFATNKNLESAVQEGTMREDLFYRIHVLPILLPALRKRAEDIPLLIEHFLQKFSNGCIPMMSPSEIEALTSYRFKGNVRELQNVVIRYISEGNLDFMKHKLAGLGSLTTEQKKQVSRGKKSLRQILSKFEKEAIYNQLLVNSWNKTQTAIDLEIDRKTLLAKIKKYHLVNPVFSDEK